MYTYTYVYRQLRPAHEGQNVVGNPHVHLRNGVTIASQQALPIGSSHRRNWKHSRRGDESDDR